MALPPTTGAPLNLYVPPYNYGAVVPPDDTWDIPANDNWEILNAFAETVVLFNPTANQTVAQPASTYLNINSPMFYGATPVVRFGVTAGVWDSAISRTAAGVFSFDTNTVGNGAATVDAGTFNAGAGFQIAGAAPIGYILVGNGTDFVASSTLPAGLGFYQTVQQAGTPVTQRQNLNFLAPLTAVDNSGNASTDVGLAPSGVAAGTYTNPSITVDTDGRVTSASSGSVVATQNNVAASRAFGTNYQNTTGSPLIICIVGNADGATGGARVTASNGPTSGGQTIVAINCNNNNGVSVTFVVPAGYWYSCVTASNGGTPTLSLSYWTEWMIG